MPSKIAGYLAPIVGIVSIASAPALAQTQSYDIGEFYIEGVRAYCGDFETVLAPDTPTLIETHRNGEVFINAAAFEALPPGVRFFVYYHNCGMGFYHDAAAADSAATRAGVRERWLNAADIEAICDTNAVVEANWSEAPDATRCDAIRATMRAALQ